MIATSHSSVQRSLSPEPCSLRFCGGSTNCGRPPCRHDGPRFRSKQTAPHERCVARVSKCAPTTRDLRHRTVQLPNQPNKPRRSPCNAPTRSQMDFDSRVCYRFRPERDAIWGIPDTRNTTPRRFGWAVALPWETGNKIDGQVADRDHSCRKSLRLCR
jgi:hypothetical protein